MAETNRDEVERITEIVLAVLDARKTTNSAPHPWHIRCAGFIIDKWTFLLSLSAILAVLIASVIYHTSPLYYVKQVATADRELDAKLGKLSFRQTVAGRYVGLGNAYLDRGHFSDAAEAFADALKFDDDNVDASLGKFKSELFQVSGKGDYNPAVISVRIRFALPENDVHALTELGDLALEVDDWQKANEYYGLALQQRETPHLQEGMGRLAYQTEHFDAAVTHFARALALAPEELSYEIDLASAYLGLGQSDTAELARYAEIVKRDQERLSPYIEYAMAFGLRGDVAQMRKVVGYALPYFENEKMMALPKNDGIWMFYVAGKRFLFHSEEEKIYYMRMLSAILLALSGDTVEADRQVTKIESSTRDLPASVKGVLAAEVAVLRRQHPDLGLPPGYLPSFAASHHPANEASPPASASR
jgi:tetratricopeptide (TPR) repeat protein